MTEVSNPIPHQVLLDWVCLAGAAGIGPITFKNLLAQTGSASEALRRLPEFAARGGKRKVEAPPKRYAEQLLAEAARLRIEPLLAIDPRYPALLHELEDAPPILWIGGDRSALDRTCIAIVGARNASLGGRKIAKAWSAELAGAGFAVVSGLARGVDGAAHEGALTQGATVAVMAGGIDAIYPPEHRELWRKILETGAIVSEMPPGTEPIAPLFPRRNRVISGLSRAVVVVEATAKSGSLITASFALDQGREVLAVPGSPLEPRAQGPNSLIRDGATLVQSVDDVLSAIQSQIGGRIPRTFAPHNSAQTIDIIEDKRSDSVRDAVLALVGADPVSVDELVRQCQTSAPVLAQALLELELAGRLVRLRGNRVASSGQG